MKSDFNTYESKLQNILGKEHFEGIKHWYKILTSNPCRYIVFTSNRSYALATIQQYLTEITLPDTSTTYITDSSLTLRLPELVDYYRKHNHFPKILLCDDILIHGQSINRVIETIEKLLIAELQDYDAEDRSISKINKHTCVCKIK